MHVFVSRHLLIQVRGEKGSKSLNSDERAKAEAASERKKTLEGRPLDRTLARDELQLDRTLVRSHGLGGARGDALLSRMEDEFVAKSGAMVFRMNAAAAQGNIAELGHE
eukprot:CAMPEP_0183377964 /NCGR_PEP_ID=MMETSP0164_2-20130417/124427_1 /TAXON_ID=221442 /ORGANISM="Coccolithus pelagicus ssp braarudi, Strain PLY182g" /LENGTH=108 /DNA_ID=CAMNT_0025555485 /DNA_START=197 /DNA_END=520 /DNA_ORIENTATION=-